MKTASIALILATAGILSEASADWPRLPSVGPQPIDRATAAIPGTVVSSSQGIGQPQAFLSADPVDGASVPVGSSEVVIQLARQYMVDTTRLINDGVEGKVTVSGSADASRWTGLGQTEITATDRSIPIAFAGAQIKFLKIAFQSSKNGVVRNLSVYGGAKTRDFHLKFSDSAIASPINFVDGVGGARVVYAYPTPSNAGEREFATNVVHFPVSNEKYRTVVYDLGVSRSVKKFTAAYSATPVRLEVFAFNQLPEGKDWRGKLTLNPSVFDGAAVVASGVDQKGNGNLKLTPNKSVKARYLAYRFEPLAGASVSFGGALSDFMNFAMLPAKSAADVLNLGVGSEFTADSEGGFSVFGIGIASSGEGTYESTPAEQGDEETPTDTDDNTATDVEDVKALLQQLWGNYGGFNQMTGSRGANNDGLGNGNGVGGDGTGTGTGTGSGDGPDIIINPTSPPPPPTAD